MEGRAQLRRLRATLESRSEVVPAAVEEIKREIAALRNMNAEIVICASSADGSSLTPAHVLEVELSNQLTRDKHQIHGLKNQIVPPDFASKSRESLLSLTGRLKDEQDNLKGTEERERRWRFQIEALDKYERVSRTVSLNVSQFDSSVGFRTFKVLSGFSRRGRLTRPRSRRATLVAKESRTGWSLFSKMRPNTESTALFVLPNRLCGAQS